MTRTTIRKAIVAAAVAAAACLLPSCDTGDTTAPDIGERTRSSAALMSFDSCSELENALKATLKEEMRAMLLSSRQIILYDDPVPVPAPEDGSAPGGDKGYEEGVDYSGTNNQEAGADESDFVKTDGYAIYLLSGERFIVLEVPAFGLLDNGTSVAIEGSPGQMLIYRPETGGRATMAVVFSTIYSCDIAGDQPLYDSLAGDDDRYRTSVLTKMTVIDLSDPTGPAVLRELYIEGTFQTARRVESAVHLIAYSWMDVYGLKYWPELPDSYYSLPYDSPERKQIRDDAVQEAIRYNDELIEDLELADLVPAIYEVSAAGQVTVHDAAAGGCDNFITAEDGMSRGFTSIVSFDLLDDDFDYDADHIVSNWSTVYSSEDTLIIAEPSQDSWWYWGADDEFEEATNIHRFDISRSGFASYSGSGRVAGTVLNQFSLSEHEGFIRVAATTGQWNRWWLEDQEGPANHVYVLAGDNGSLHTVGQVGPIAEGEKIWSARFVGDRAFLVTFRNIDPLWTIDLGDPEHPFIAGELEIEGVSTYVHPLGDELLLTIGYGGDTEGLDWKVQVSLFDVADFSSPALLDALTLTPPEGEGWSTWASSEALYEHKAFQYWAPKNLLAVPLSTHRSRSGPNYYYYEYLSRLDLVHVDTAGTLSYYGSVDHSEYYNSDTDIYWCTLEIRRSIFMGDYIYAVGDRAVTASDLATMDITAAVTLPGDTCGYPPDEVTVETGKAAR